MTLVPGPFKELSEPELQELAQREPDRLIAQIHSARLVGDNEYAITATTILVLSLERFIRATALKYVRRHELDEVADGAALELVNAVRDYPPELGSMVQLRVWVGQIVFRYCAGLTRKGQHLFMRDTWSIDDTYEDGTLRNEPHGEDFGFDFVEYQEVVDRQLDCLSEEHRIIVELRLMERVPSKEVAERLRDEHGLTYKPNTIDQVASRFRNACLGEIDGQCD